MSSKKYKVVVSDTVVVPVEGSLTDGGGQKQKFKFSLICKRLGDKDLKEAIGVEDKLTRDFLIDVTTGWKDQRLVVDEDGTDAEFCPEAFDALLDIAGLVTLCFAAYMKEVGAKVKN